MASVRSARLPRSVAGAGSAVARHPVLAVFLLALAVRTAVAVAVAWRFGGSLLLDDAAYSDLAAAAAAGRAGEGWDQAYARWLYERTATLLVPLTGIYAVLGPVKLAGQLFVALLGAATAAVTTRLALEALPPRWALVPGLIVAVLPSQVLWSSIIMKDAAVWLSLSGLALLMVLAQRSSGGRLALLGLAALAPMVALGYLRLYSLVVAAWALMLTAWAGPRAHRLPRTIGAIALGVGFPWLAFDLGPAGFDLTRSAGNLSERRALNAESANTAFVAPYSSQVRRPWASRASSSGCSTPAPASERAGSRRCAEELFGATPPQAPRLESGLSDNLRHLPLGLSVVLFEPVPWRPGGSAFLQLARAEAVVWYGVLASALAGLFALRRWFSVALFPLVVGAGTLLMYALTEGNIGTAYRHRGEFVWVVALAAGFGAFQIARWRSRSRQPAASPSPPAARALRDPGA